MILENIRKYKECAKSLSIKNISQIITIKTLNILL